MHKHLGEKYAMWLRQPQAVHLLLTILIDMGLLWVLFQYGFGGLENTLQLLVHFGPWSWLTLAIVLLLLLYKSNWSMDLPLFLSGNLLGFWGEWWGTTRGLWTYWNGATPPDYLPPLWGIGLITVYRLGRLIQHQKLTDARWMRLSMVASFLIFPALTFLGSWSHLSVIDWRNHLDVHFIAGLVTAGLLIAYQFNLVRVFTYFFCGTLLGGAYEYLGTSMGEWTYITYETPPLWIAPLWGFASVAMISLAAVLRAIARKIIAILTTRWKQ